MHYTLALGTLGTIEILIIFVLLAIIATPIGFIVYFLVQTWRLRKKTSRLSSSQPPGV